MHSCYPPKPPHPRSAPPQGYLLQKIIACEKRSLPCLCAEWCFDSCSAHCIQNVAVCGAPLWTMENGCTLRITLPLSVRLCDACGHCVTQPASVELETALPHSFLCGMDDPRSTLLILPCVRLIRAEERCGGCFRVQLAVSVEICLLRYEICRCQSPKPQCPQLPLYPQPIC